MMTLDEKIALLEAGMDAQDRGDQVLADQLLNQIPLAPHLGRGLVEIIGYDKAVAHGANLSEVEEIYGHNWYKSL